MEPYPGQLRSFKTIDGATKLSLVSVAGHDHQVVEEAHELDPARRHHGRRRHLRRRLLHPPGHQGT
jgi:hypothetical protein